MSWLKILWCPFPQHIIQHRNLTKTQISWKSNKALVYFYGNYFDAVYIYAYIYIYVLSHLKLLSVTLKNISFQRNVNSVCSIALIKCTSICINIFNHTNWGKRVLYITLSSFSLLFYIYRYRWRIIHIPVLWKNWLTGKELDAGKDWRQEEKGTTEDKMVGWASLTQWTWVLASSGSWWWTGKPGTL